MLSFSYFSLICPLAICGLCPAKKLAKSKEEIISSWNPCISGDELRLLSYFVEFFGRKFNLFLYLTECIVLGTIRQK